MFLPTILISVIVMLWIRPTLVRSFPVPKEYQRIHQDLYQFLEHARDLAGVETTHRSYTMCQGVFLAFRRRLAVEDALKFSSALPAGIRSMFVAEWDLTTSSPTTNKAIAGFESREELIKEVQSLRSTHNFAPDTAIENVAQALRMSLGGGDEEKLDQVLESIGEDAVSFWSVAQEAEACDSKEQ